MTAPRQLDDRRDESEPASGDYHVAGVVVHARIESLRDVVRALETLPGAQVHGESADGKLVLTLEAHSARHIAERLSAVQALPDVIGVALVYQQHETVDSQNEDNLNETDSSRFP
ncbi:periplasmic diheme c-type cytochrome, NapB [Candidatus Burkholderia verschuerenii]|uniref:Chaperone NapD n=1 Tax=Candidatus Burkholderia verschuerenii TaxID=242163 RepID=A0A0L0MF37_9BURK|nr:chaperone NapD [Candidatus Burkholderia verschuerenii]KND60900.1 periplasmic diheme c-type cytochrome, NapB [Candidatus Burkholderia verschuerenii]